MPKTKVEVYDKDQLIYPYIESDHVTFSNGMKVSEMLDQSISMPTITHNETSFKVGVGDSDVSNSIVDSSVSKMVIKGQTYQNILPEPSTHVLTNNKEMFKVNEGLDPNVEIVDGVSKSAILSGHTLVNLARQSFKNIQISTDENVTSGPNSRYVLAKFSIDNIVKPNTKYNLRLNSKFISGDIEANHFKICWYNGSSYIAETSFYSPKDDGAYNIVFTTPNDCNSITLALPRRTDSGAHTSTYEYSDGLLIEYQEGMENWDIPYFEGMQSVKMPVLTTTGKNLFDGKIKRGVPNSDSGWEEYIQSENFIRVNSIDFILSINLEYITDSEFVRIYCYDENKNFISTKAITEKKPLNTKYIKFSAQTKNNPSNLLLPYNIQIEYGTTPTTYEPYKTNILSTPEEVALRGIGDVQDTLNCLTGEVVERIGEVVLDGSADETWHTITASDSASSAYVEGYVTAYTYLDNFQVGTSVKLINDKGLQRLPYTNTKSEGLFYLNGYIGMRALILRIDESKVNNSIREYLQANPITVQYQLTTESIKTVDLSSSGNWEKVVLDGSQVLSQYSASSTGIIYYGLPISDIVPLSQGGKAFANILLTPTKDIGGVKYGITPANSLNILCFSLDGVMNKEEARAYLSQNPITVWYQTTTTLDSTQVKQPIFFKDGHIQLSSGVDNSLVPTLDYQAKTSNSYVMDLMKANTRYTMKAKTASGNFTIDGTSYGAGTNGTFTTPTSMTNKLLVMSNKANEEVMILEGDVTDKTIPYFKGIKSAFEDESKIEVLSTGKNLFDINSVVLSKYGRIEGNSVILDIDTEGTFSHAGKFEWVVPNGMKGKTITLKADKNGGGNIEFRQYDKSNNQLYVAVSSGVSTTILDDTYKIQLNFNARLSSGVTTWSNVRLVVGTDITYEPYKSNSTKIPLLSPLRSLPNGVCDELIIDRMKKKATLIQRVGYVKFDNMDKLGFGDDGGKQYIYLISDRHIYFANRIELASAPAIFSHFAYYTDGNLGTKDRGDYAAASDIVFCWCMPTKRDKGERERHLRNLAKQDGVVVQYQLKNPVITEVDLEGFPYIYKDGHIFLNSEIAPTTEIIYSINQCQQIYASNEDIIRHEKELTYLQKLIAQYVQVDYESVLLSLKV